MIRYSFEAQADLLQIRGYYEALSPQTSRNIVEDIASTVLAIPTDISKGRKTDLDDVWEKLTPKYRYLIPYRMLNGEYVILRIYDQRQGRLNYSNL